MNVRIRAVILDWAGTTVDHGSRAPARVFVEIFRRCGVAIDEAEARGPMGKAKRDHIASILALPRVSAAWRERFGAEHAESDIDRLYEEFLPLQRETLAGHGDVIPGVRGSSPSAAAAGSRSAHDGLHPRPHGRPGADRAGQWLRARRLHLRRRRAARASRAWMLFRAAERLGVYPMSDVVAVDDTPVGIEAARNAGA